MGAVFFPFFLASQFTDLLRCILYIVFVSVMIRLHTFPLFSIRPLYLTIRAFYKAFNDVILSRRAINAMNNLFPLATEQELSQGKKDKLLSNTKSSVKFRKNMCMLPNNSIVLYDWQVCCFFSSCHILAAIYENLYILTSIKVTIHA